MNNPFKVTFSRNERGYFFRNKFTSLVKRDGEYIIQFSVGFGWDLLEIKPVYYRSKRRPIFRHLGLLTILLFPVTIVAFIFAYLLVFLITIFTFIFGMQMEMYESPYLFKPHHYCSLFIWNILGIIGVFYLFKLTL